MTLIIEEIPHDQVPVRTGKETKITVDYGKASGTGAAILAFCAQIAEKIVEWKQWDFPFVITANSRMGKNAMQVAGRMVGEGGATNPIGIAKGRFWKGRAFEFDIAPDLVAPMDVGRLVDAIFHNMGKLACLNRTDNVPVPHLDPKTGILTRMAGQFEEWYERELGVEVVKSEKRGDITAVRVPKTAPRLFDDEERSKGDAKCRAYSIYLWAQQNADIRTILKYRRDQIEKSEKAPSTRSWIAPCGDKLPSIGAGVFKMVDCVCSDCVDKETGFGYPYAPMIIGGGELPDHMITAEQIRAARKTEELQKRFMDTVKQYDKAYLDAREDRKVESQLVDAFKQLPTDDKRELLNLARSK